MTLTLNYTMLSLHNLPIEIVYRIFDNLNDKELFLSTQNICQRLNSILNSYRRYETLTQVNLAQSEIDDEGAQWISEALQNNTVKFNLLFASIKLFSDNPTTRSES